MLSEKNNMLVEKKKKTREVNNLKSRETCNNPYFFI